MDVKFEDRTSLVTPVTILARTLPRNLVRSFAILVRPPNSQVFAEHRIDASPQSGLHERCGEGDPSQGVQGSARRSQLHLLPHLGPRMAPRSFVLRQSPCRRAFKLLPRRRTTDGLLQAFETVVPNELTRIRLRITDVSIHVSPLNLKSHLVISFGDARIATNLMPDMPRTLATVEIARLRVLAVDGTGDLLDGAMGAASGEEYWKVSLARPLRGSWVDELIWARSRKVSCSLWTSNGLHCRFVKAMGSFFPTLRFVSLASPLRRS